MQTAPFFMRRGIRTLLPLAAILTLSACQGGSGFNLPFLEARSETGETGGFSSGTRTELIEHDVEAPDVFQVTEAGLWDGRPSLGGVWVAHPDARDPERVIIRNNANGKFVIGALFRREREIPGPRVQISSNAAEALGMLAGAPVEVNVTALRKEAVEEQSEESAFEALQTAALETTPLETTPLETTPLSDDPIAGAAAAIEASAPKPAAPKPAAKPAPKPKPVAVSSKLEKPFIQIGIFSVKANAKRTADIMRNAGIIPATLEGSSNGKPFWRVVVGPANTKTERSQLLKQVRDTGFTDAYAVTN